jgi:hypothetical protein
VVRYRKMSGFITFEMRGVFTFGSVFIQKGPSTMRVSINWIGVAL